eukprot:09788.XXX_629324_629503_1 [CDS] Oithona nana genome sequencing.
MQLGLQSQNTIVSVFLPTFSNDIPKLVLFQYLFLPKALLNESISSPTWKDPSRPTQPEI